MARAVVSLPKFMTGMRVWDRLGTIGIRHQQDLVQATLEAGDALCYDDLGAQIGRRVVRLGRGLTPYLGLSNTCAMQVVVVGSQQQPIGFGQH